MRRFLATLLALVMTLALMIPTAWAGEGADITVYYTNDIHTYIDGNNNYAKLATLKKNTANALLVDAGDHVQGTAFGGMDKGAKIVELMQMVGYDVATLGNHEFDYGMARTLEIVGGSVPYVSCNFYHEAGGVPGALVLDAYKIFEVEGKKVAFVGITTPESFTKSTPAYFQDGSGNYIYGIAGGKDGAALYSAVQNAIDAAKTDGADYIIALGHLGDDPASDPWNSEDVIANTKGLNAFIDGHSHSSVASKEVEDKDGNKVILSQTGNYFEKVGKLTISASGITAELIDIASVEEDPATKAKEDSWIGDVKSLLGEKIADSTIDFTIQYPGKTEKRGVRSTETNMGDLNADAYYWAALNAGLEPDMAIMNGGGVRGNIAAGDWTYESCKTVNTFGNVLCVVEVTGQQIKDALEFGARLTTGDPANFVENGGFLQVAGCTYKVDANVKNTIPVDDKGVWQGGPSTISGYRVSDIKIFNRTTGTYDALDLAKTYRVSGTNYTLYDCGDGFNMFKGGTHVLDNIYEDYMALAEYLKAFKDTDADGYAEITSANSPLAALTGYQMNYENAAGAGRIEIEPLVFVSWDGKITIGGTTLNQWFTKYGNTYCDCTVEHFSGTEDNGLGFEVGDIVTVKFLGKEIQLPVVTNYSDVDSGMGCIKLGTNQYVELAINMGNFGNTYGLVNITKDGSGVYSVAPCAGVTFPVELTFEMYEKGGYLSEYLMHQLSRTDVRTDYADLSDAEFANFRKVTTTGMGKNFYRGSSPVNPEIGRNVYADAALKTAGVNVIMNLADSQAAAAAYPGFNDTYYAEQDVIYLNLGVDFTAADFKAGLAKGMKFFANPAFEGKNFYVHCTEGKDRAGFVSALLECLMGATADEVIEDYMVTYANYYGVKPGTEQYDAIANSNIVKSLCRSFGVEDLSTANLQAKAQEYMKALGLSDSEIAQLKTNLGDPNYTPVKTGDNGVAVYFVLAALSTCAGAAMIVKRKEQF